MSKVSSSVMAEIPARQDILNMKALETKGLGEYQAWMALWKQNSSSIRMIGEQVANIQYLLDAGIPAQTLYTFLTTLAANYNNISKFFLQPNHEQGLTDYRDFSESTPFISSNIQQGIRPQQILEKLAEGSTFFLSTLPTTTLTAKYSASKELLSFLGKQQASWDHEKKKHFDYTQAAVFQILYSSDIRHTPQDESIQLPNEVIDIIAGHIGIWPKAALVNRSSFYAAQEEKLSWQAKIEQETTPSSKELAPTAESPSL